MKLVCSYEDMANVATTREVNDVDVNDTMVNHVVAILPYFEPQRYFGPKRNRFLQAMVNIAPKRWVAMEVGQQAKIPLMHDSDDPFPSFDLERDV